MHNNYSFLKEYYNENGKSLSNIGSRLENWAL
jgi:hypothetical protein